MTTIAKHPRQSANPCGSDAGYQGHRRHGEEPCGACLDAHNAYQAANGRKPANREHRREYDRRLRAR